MLIPLSSPPVSPYPAAMAQNSPQDDRKERLAAALRENLKRRKAQARATTAAQKVKPRCTNLPRPTPRTGWVTCALHKPSGADIPKGLPPPAHQLPIDRAACLPHGDAKGRWLAEKGYSSWIVSALPAGSSSMA